MIRQTSIDAYNKIKEEGLLSERRWQVYDILANHGPATANELLKHFKKKYSSLYGNSPQMTSRLGELRNLGVAIEKRQRPCSITGMLVIEWEITNKLPVKFEKPKREKCKACDGKGYIEEAQARLF